MAEQTEKIDIKSMLPDELAAYLRSLGQPAYRAKQLFRWFSAGCGSWDEMSNLPRLPVSYTHLTLPTNSRV